MSIPEPPCETLVSLLRSKTTRLFDFLSELLPPGDEIKKEALQDLHELVQSMSDSTFIMFLRVKHPDDPINLRSRIDAMCAQHGISPDPVQLLRLLRYGSFFQAALWGGPTA